MLKKLRRKFVFINVCLVGIVLIAVFTVLCVNTYQNQMAEAEKTLQRALEGKSLNLENDFFAAEEDPLLPSPDRKVRNFTPAVVVEINTNGVIINTYEDNLGISGSTLAKAVSQAFNRDDYSGSLKSLDLYYMKQVSSDSIKVAFIDSTYFENTIKKTILTSILLFVFGLIIIFFISLLLSGIALNPVKKAWKQQQQFVADASHELKTPLTVILANNNILLAHKESSIASQEKWIESTQAEASHMGKLVNDLLFLAKSDGEENHTIFSEIHLSDLCQNAILQFEPVAFEKGLKLNGTIQPEVLFKGDNTQLNQLLHILLDNACKYTPDGGEITVTLQKTGSEIKLSVANTGSVIPREDLPHIFERFYRSDKSRTRESGSADGGGYGLGLAIAKTISEKHHGTISVESNEEKGTVFYVYFK